MQVTAKLAIAMGIISGGMLLGTPGTKTAIAKCVQADIGVQYNINGSRVPARQSNDVQFEGSGRCVGNTNVTTGVQGNVGGTNRVIQRRRVRQKFQGERSRGRQYQRRNGGNDFIRIKVNPQLNIYNPAEQYRKD